MAAAMLSLRAQTAGNVLACSNLVRDLSHNSQKRDAEAAYMSSGSTSSSTASFTTVL
jgi:hypothetical protein